MHSDKARAEPFDAGIVLVAARLIDCTLAPELRFDRHHRNAIRSFRAVAAALANQVIDKDPLGWIGEATALASAAFFGGTGLVVNDSGDTRDFAQFALNRIEVIAVAHCGA